MSKFCPNCYQPLKIETDYCGHCGQKFTTGKVSIWKVTKEFISDTFSLDSKVIRSIGPLLFKPGELTIKYFQGKHKQYVSPVRLWLFLSIIFFAILAYNAGDLVKINLSDEINAGLKEKTLNSIQYNNFVEDIDSIVTELKAQVNDPNARNEIDSAFKDFKMHELDDSLSLTTFDFGENFRNRIKIARTDLFTKSAEELVEQTNYRNKFERMFNLKLIKIAADGGSFAEFLFNRISWMIFFMLPLIAITLKVLYFFSNRYLVEHLIFGIHFNCFLFIVGIAIWMANSYSGQKAFIIGVVVSQVYLFIAMKRFYGQGFFMTFIKFFLLTLGASLASILSVLGLMALGMALY